MWVPCPLGDKGGNINNTDGDDGNGHSYDDSDDDTGDDDGKDNKLAKALQALTPSAHVWSKFASLTPPQLLNQAPPRAQQLI